MYRVYLFTAKTLGRRVSPQLLNRHLWRIISKPNHLRVENIELVVAKTPSPVILKTYDSGDVHSAFGFVVG